MNSGQEWRFIGRLLLASLAVTSISYCVFTAYVHFR